MQQIVSFFSLTTKYSYDNELWIVVCFYCYWFNNNFCISETKNINNKKIRVFFFHYRTTIISSIISKDLLLTFWTHKNIIGVNIHKHQHYYYTEWFTARLSKNAVSAFQISYKLLSFTLERVLKKLADNQYSSITKGSIHHVKHMYIQPFTTVVDWSEI